MTDVRKITYHCEEVLCERGRILDGTTLRATAAVVISNPWYATRAGDDLRDVSADVAPSLAKELTSTLLDRLGGAGRIEAFGKAAIVGLGGEIEHGAALIHTPYFGNLMREFLEGESIICFADDRLPAGSSLTVPMWHKSHATTRSHYQTVSVRVADAPRADEIVIVAAASTGPRPLARIGDRATDPIVHAQDLELSI